MLAKWRISQTGKSSQTGIKIEIDQLDYIKIENAFIKIYDSVTKSKIIKKPATHYL